MTTTTRALARIGAPATRWTDSAADPIRIAYLTEPNGTLVRVDGRCVQRVDDGRSMPRYYLTDGRAARLIGYEYPEVTSF